jgi:beta-N-acetylhexosaminidase
MKSLVKWTAEELAAQCIVGRLDTDKYFEDTHYRSQIMELARNFIGGFCVFGGDLNKVQLMTAELQLTAELPLIFCADFENGLQMRLSEGTAFPHSMALGRLKFEESYTKRTAELIATEAKAIGINWVLAPVSDINSNPQNPIINIRSFGETSEVVSFHSNEFINGLQSKDVAACSKHFPGHGDTNVDSHLALPFINKPLKHLKELELIPFIENIKNGVMSIMVGHLTLNNEEFGSEPASINRKIIEDLLIEQLGFNGLIVTDALDMNAIINTIDADIAAYLAISAGAHIALMPQNVLSSIRIFAEKIENSDSLRDKVTSAVNQIISFKRKCKVLPQFAKDYVSNEIFTQHPKIALEAALLAISKSGESSLIPINPETKFAVFGVLNSDKDFDSALQFFKMTAQALENECDFAFLDMNLSNGQLAELKEGIIDTDTIIFAVFDRPKAYTALLGTAEKLNLIVQDLAEKKKVIVILFGNPYLEKSIKYDLCIMPFSDSYPSLAATVVLLSGRENAVLGNL